MDITGKYTKLVDNKIQPIVSCESCMSVKVCKFYTKAKELFNSNEFYQMVEYAEWNNNLEMWSKNKRCQHYISGINNKLFMQKEIKSKTSHLAHGESWFTFAKEYFMQLLYPKYKAYFEVESQKQKQKAYFKDKKDEDIIQHCYQTSSNNNTYTFEANDKSWKETISLMEMLEYFKAFQT